MSGSRTRSLQEAPGLAQLAVQMLTEEGPISPFSRADAEQLLPYLRLVDVPKGATLMQEGDQLHTGHLLLVLEGQISVHTVVAGASIEVAVVGPGDLLGEVALLDGGPRTASCSALSEAKVAALGRQALHQLLQVNPAVAAHLLAALGRRMAGRIRELDAQLEMYMQLVGEQQQR
ncbi:CRP-like cAMP-binding protein [Inhella inkyongensis]|uniref:CRP-like cAMP-binding protein n=1 Tax=Inhella inkyongensis TaxID=392593 RepID=A0A840S0M7_9BURK|nr:cyclic nucleotide-binding domain-containing protein [Inhella inkyongensis]MBB5204627.1 CRP-like cAMP-binding protein [Inhella inkyongensis]